MHFFDRIDVHGRQRFLCRKWLTALLVFLISGFITLFCVYLQPGSFLESMRTFYHQPRLIFLNWFPALVFTAITYFLTKNVFYGGAISGGVMAVTSAFGSGIAVFADIMVIIGMAFILLALGLLALWIAVWLVGGAMVGLVRGLIHLGGKWCYKEVEA